MLAGSTAGCRQHTGQLEKQHCIRPRCRQGCQLVGQRICLQGEDQLCLSYSGLINSMAMTLLETYVFHCVSDAAVTRHLR